MAKKPKNGQPTEIDKLFDAAFRGAVEEVDELVAKGISPDSRDELDRTPIIRAAEAGKVDVVRKLLDHGADVNAIDVDGETATITATYGDHRDVVEVLHLHGADLEVRNNEGKTALEIARESDYIAIAAYLAEHSTDSPVIHNSEAPRDPDDEGPATSGPAGAVNPPEKTGDSSRASEQVPPVDSGEAEEPKVDVESVEPGEMGGQDQLDGEDEAESASDQTQTSRPAPEAGTDQGSGQGGFEMPLTSTRSADMQPASIEEMAVAVRHILFHTVESGLEQVGTYLLVNVFNGDIQQVFSKKPNKGKASLSKIADQPDMPLRRQQLADCVRVAALNQVFRNVQPELEELPFSHKAEIARLKDEDQRLNLAKRAYESKLTVQSVRDAVRELAQGVSSEDRKMGKTILRQVGEVLRFVTDKDAERFMKDKARMKAALESADRIQMIRQASDARKHVAKSMKLLEGLKSTLVAIEMEGMTGTSDTDSEEPAEDEQSDS